VLPDPALPSEKIIPMKITPSLLRFNIIRWDFHEFSYLTPGERAI
jgi:hypothetical protein